MKKTLNITISVVLVLILFISNAPLAFAADSIASFEVNNYGGDEDAIDTVKWYAKDEQYYLFMPSDADMNTAKVYFKASNTVKFDGEVLENGGSAAALTAGEHTLSCGATTYSLLVCFSANVPAVYITTESGSLSFIHKNKQNKEPGNIRIYDDGVKTVDKELKYIKGRGNASWTYPKKSYNIKFDKKTNIFGMGKAKKWTLLANYHDMSLMRNVYGWDLSNAFGLPYASEYKHVDLYVNGNYMGNYIICESVEIDSERINIRDLSDANEKVNPDIDLEMLPQIGTGENGSVESGSVKDSAKWIDIPNSPDNIEGGYLLEFEIAKRYNAELCGFVTENGQPFVIKEPELASQSEVNYIRNIVNDAMNAVYSDTGYNDKGKHYSEYFDMDSFVNMYILQELSNNVDAGYTSQFLYKAENSDKLVFSPIWDLDHALGFEGTRFEVNIGDPTIWWANGNGFKAPLVFGAVYRHDDFRTLVTNRWAQIAESSVIENALTKVHELSENIAASGIMNILRWDTTKTVGEAQTLYVSELQKGEKFISTRCGWLSKGFAADSAMLYYDANGGTGYIFHPEILSIGDTATPISCERTDNRITAPTGYYFAGWNTKADGNGDMYQPGDAFVVTQRVNTLYAQWKKIEVMLQSISVKTNPTKTTYCVGETLDTSGLSVTATYSNGSRETITSDFICSPMKLQTAGQQTITVSYKGETTTFVVIVKAIVRSVSVNDLSLNYKSSVTLTPQITADEGATFTVTYTSSNPSVATVDNNGKVTSVKQSGLNRGSTVITCTATDSYGNTVTDTCKVSVQFTWWQWIIKLILFGWIWY